MPSFNQGEFIEKAILSILSQDYKVKELIIVDNQSTDKTNDILLKYSKQITVLQEKDNGQTEAINKGLKTAKGDILAYLNSDDIYEKNTFKIVDDYFIKHPNVKIVYGVGRFIDEKGKFAGYYKTKSPTLENLFKECVISQPTVFMRREIYETIGPLDENLDYTMDYDYWIKVAKKYKFSFINKPLASTRLHKNSKTSSQSEKVFKEILAVLKNNFGKVSDEAVFNYSYIAGRTALKKIKQAISIYIKYCQFPKKVGQKHILILIKSIFKKRS